MKCELLCQHLKDIWTDRQPQVIGPWLFISVLPTGQKDLENSAKYVAWVSGAEVIIILCGVREWG